MPIREFEMFHGALLTKLVRSDRPIALRMIETRPSQAWSTYLINDAVRILVKYSATPRKLTRERGAVRWNFIFSPDQMYEARQEGTWVALVCGADRIIQPMEVCLVNSSEIASLLDLNSSSQQWIAVKYLPNKSLRVSTATVEDYIIPRNRCERWAIPGS